MNTIRTADLPQVLPRRECFWGDIYTGTKAQLNAFGFGVGCAFPGEPKGGKRERKLPSTLGYAAVTVRPNWLHRHEDRDEPLEKRTFEVFAHLVADEQWECKQAIQFAPGVTLRKEIHFDAYTGTAQGLMHAGLLEKHQLPGMPGCGKCTTTFDLDGNVVKKQSVTIERPASKTVSKYGVIFRVRVAVVSEEQDERRRRDHENNHAYQLKCMEARRQKQIIQSAPRPRPALRLVWSAQRPG